MSRRTSFLLIGALTLQETVMKCYEGNQTVMQRVSQGQPKEVTLLYNNMALEHFRQRQKQEPRPRAVGEAGHELNNVF